MITEAINNFTVPVYTKAKPNNETLVASATHCKDQLTALVKECQQTSNNQRMLVEYRNSIEHYLRRYHDTCIKGRKTLKSHYIEVGAKRCDFEHLIPVYCLKEMLIHGIISIDEALNAPTVLLSKENHKLLQAKGWDSRTPDMWLPFKRYSAVFNAKFQTFDGTEIDPDTWTLAKHYDYFNWVNI